MRSSFPVGPVVLLALSGCGGGSSTPTTPNPTPANAYTFTITAGAITPKELTVPQGTRVLFVNHGTGTRDMNSDPHPEHDVCPEINVGRLTPGQNRETQNLNIVRTCGFHDHDDPTNTAVQGRIIIRP